MAANIPPLPTVLAFIDRINQRDLDGLVALMTDGHCLKVLDEPTSCGKERMREAWRGFFDAYPRYLIYPERFASTGETVAVLGRTTGSHLDLPDEAELKLTVIWVAEVRDGLVASWTILQDTEWREHGWASPERFVRRRLQPERTRRPFAPYAQTGRVYRSRGMLIPTTALYLEIA